MQSVAGILDKLLRGTGLISLADLPSVTKEAEALKAKAEQTEQNQQSSDKTDH